MEIKDILTKMTLEEKAGICSGKDYWHLKGLERFGIESIMVSDGPHGLRKQKDEEDHLGINESIETVCFPTACSTACSFDRDLLRQMGEALGDECQAEGVSVLLGPAVNIKRSPLCGRNFEYFSEDPYLTGELAKQFILGVQSKHVGTSLKHFAANNQEYRRMTCSSEIDERTLREIYLTAFEIAVKEAKPWTVMCSYNRLNGIYASENTMLLTDILRKEWGFDGYVVSDWGAVNDRVKALKAGLDLEMPASDGTTDREIVDAVKNGSLEETVLDTAVERILKKSLKYLVNHTEGVLESRKHHMLAKKIAIESAVLLKNENRILPLSKKAKVAFIGLFAKEPRFQGGGSSHINADRVSAALEAAPHPVMYAQGYQLEDRPDEELLREALEVAKKADVAVIFAGLPDSFESECYDRSHMRLPHNQNQLISSVADIQPNTVVVLHNGSPVELPWEKKVCGILEMYLGGQAVGEASCALLFGDANPCGKLAETFPLRIEDNPSYLYFPGDGKKAEYREGIFVGYRYYDTKNLSVRYPFGFGLSYTTFEYESIELSADDIRDTDTLMVWITLKNTGTITGKEIIQLYVSDKTGAAVRPKKELKNFVKVELSPGERKKVAMRLTKRAFAWYSSELMDWYAAAGEYEISVGSSSQDIYLRKNVKINCTQNLPWNIDENTVIGDIMKNVKTANLFNKYYQKVVSSFTRPHCDNTQGAITQKMIIQQVDNLPLRAMRSFCSLTSQEIKSIVNQLNWCLRG